jgi:hypothetical protein
VWAWQWLQPEHFVLACVGFVGGYLSPIFLKWRVKPTPRMTRLRLTVLMLIAATFVVLLRTSPELASFLGGFGLGALVSVGSMARRAATKKHPANHRPIGVTARSRPRGISPGTSPLSRDIRSAHEAAHQADEQAMLPGLDEHD